MTTAFSPVPLTTLLPVALMGLMLLRRYHQLAAPQALDASSRQRLLRRPVILGVLALALLALPHSLSSYLAALIGALLGVGLAYWAAQHTRYDLGADGQATRYIPNAWIGRGIFLVFLGRLLWKMWPVLGSQLHVTSGTAVTHSWTAQHWSTQSMGNMIGTSPLTFGLFLLFVGYQMVYPLLMLRAARLGPLTTRPVAS